MADALTCPGCRASIPEERRLEGAMPIWDGIDGEVDRTPFACPGCLAIVAIEVSLPPGRAYWDEPAPTPELKTVLLVSGAAVARLLERIRADASACLGTMAELHSDTVLRLVLRIPEVFAAVRPLLGSKAVMALPGFFVVTRGSRTYTSPGGGVGVEGYWTPESSEPELTPVHPHVEKRWLEWPETKEEPWIRQPVAVLQVVEGQAMLVRGAPLDVLGEDRTFLKIRPLDSQWVKSGAITFLRATLDLLMPDPDRI